MNFPLTGSPFDTDEYENIRDKGKRIFQKNKTIKNLGYINNTSNINGNTSNNLNKQNRLNPNVKSIIDSIHNSDNSNKSHKNMGSFSPPPQSILTKRTDTNIDADNESHSNENYETDVPPYLDNTIASNDYSYKQNWPGYMKDGVGDGNIQLIEKMNYIIHMLEEQQDEKTENITEELLLYSFLGVFLIFIVDSFARSGKYNR